MKKYALLATLTSLSLLATSCDEKEKMTTPPTFKGFTITPAVVHPGDVVRVSAHYANRGEYWNAPECSWSFTVDTTNVEKNERFRAHFTQMVQQSVADEMLTTTFIVPKSADAPCKVYCILNVAMNTTVTTPNVNAKYVNITEPGYEGRFESSFVASTLFCTASGSVNFTVTPIE
ncbi:MAG: hypothetical protein KBT12_06195 [Bacteroidales bacterium]|nr:hypothetical protein [Candidatus Physcousia equi]